MWFIQGAAPWRAAPLMSDTDQFESFVREHQDKVFATALRILGNEAEARDVAQETFLRAWRHWPEISASPNAAGWLKTVARNQSINLLQRHRARWRNFTDLAPDEPDGPSFESTLSIPETQPGHVLNGERRAALEHGIAQLPPDQRAALVLYHFEDMDYAEIARALGASLGKVKTDIHRARRALYQRLQPLRDDLGC